jgi:L-alanine-DL-glutamate epimerase-like enolase superfamily enzyme
MNVTSVDLALLSFPLPMVVRLGPVHYTTREYVAVRLNSDRDGVCGFGLGYTRGTPLFAGGCLLARQFIGADPVARTEVLESIEAAHRPGLAALVRPLSLFEMALADLAAKDEDCALYELEGGVRRSLPAMGVCGYFIDDRGEDAVLEDLGRLEQEGFGLLKLMLGMREIGWLRSFLGRAKERLDPATVLGVDLHYGLADLDEGLDLMGALDELELGFVEDPFDPPRWRELERLARQTITPLAVGEDVTSPLQYRDLLDSAQILRVDPTSSGGFGAARLGIEDADSRGIPVIPHGVAGACAQLAGAYPAVSALEITPPGMSADGIDEMIDAPFSLVDGVIELDTEPGNGIRLDWDAIGSAAEQSWSVAQR